MHALSHSGPIPGRLAQAILLSIGIHALLVLGVRLEIGLPGTANALRVHLIPVSSADRDAVATPAVTAAVEERQSADTPDRVVERPPVEGSREAQRPGRAEQDGNAAANLPIYYSSKEVDVRAAPMDLSNRSRAERSVGMALGRIARVKLRLFISDAGTVDRFDIIEVDAPPGPLPLEEFREMRFYPAMKNGVPVRSQKLVELSFVP